MSYVNNIFLKIDPDWKIGLCILTNFQEFIICNQIWTTGPWVSHKCASWYASFIDILTFRYVMILVWYQPTTIRKETIKYVPTLVYMVFSASLCQPNLEKQKSAPKSAQFVNTTRRAWLRSLLRWYDPSSSFTSPRPCSKTAQPKGLDSDGIWRLKHPIRLTHGRKLACACRSQLIDFMLHTPIAKCQPCLYLDEHESDLQHNV